MQNVQNSTIDENEQLEKDGPSKTKRKEHMDELQKLGMELVELSKDKLSKIELPDALIDAVKLAQKITANGAIRRQSQYIGKLMRTVDEDYIRRKLEELNSDSVKNTKMLHLCENWRERLLKDDGELNTFITQYQPLDVTELRSLIRATRKEQLAGQIKSYRKLFKIIRETLGIKELPTD